MNLRRIFAAVALLALPLLAQAQPAARPYWERCPPGAPPIADGTPTPLEIYGPLFEAVQAAALFPDSKSFADAVPRRDPGAIMADYCRTLPAGETALRAFVDANFLVPETRPAPPPSKARPPLADHIRALWPVLARPALDPPPGSSALALPQPYVVPGGRFREIYYWDSYFTMLGLKADGRGDLIESMLADFVSLVERFGHVPNGSRTYYVSRSQPPFLYLMMRLSDARDPGLLARRLKALRREHGYWMGAGRMVTMPDGSLLNRYMSHRELPREESWREDVALAKSSGRPAGDLYRDVRAAAESGWDFSSRWFADGRTLATIDTTNIVPVDLNSLLFGLETAIRDRCTEAGDGACASEFAERAAKRRAAIERWLWSDKERRYGDWDLARGALRPGITAAALYPLFTGVADRGPRADALARSVELALIAPGGLRTTTVETGQQWDSPNGWAPLQWIAYQGLSRVGHQREANRILRRFLATVEREYQASGRLLEKYDVEKQAPGGGGEYPTQDGFGWTNGVVRALMEQRAPKAAGPLARPAAAPSPL